ncbi:MAG: hypothetical protein SGARI_004389 [Bacillariaceae sp.]
MRKNISGLLLEGDRSEALEQALAVLEQMGERFPKAGIPQAVDREMEKLRNDVRQRDNAALLRPKRMTDKKTLDVMELLGSVLEISRLCRKKGIQELVMIRMVNLSLRHGFTRQYPMAFAYFSMSLVQHGIKKSDPVMVKEAHRMGQVTERMARLGDFYGGQSVALFHWHVSHWKRLYKRTLEPVLAVYNAQLGTNETRCGCLGVLGRLRIAHQIFSVVLDAGDFFHVEFSIFTYINM